MEANTKEDVTAAAAEWKARRASLGPRMNLLRALPGVRGNQAIGPFVLLDHLGPMPTPKFPLGAHPHAGIEVISYFLEGSGEHRDSTGRREKVGAGDAQWMTAGRGILHAEKIGDEGPTLQMLQLWTRLPKKLEDVEPKYRNVPAQDVPEMTNEGATVRLVAGELPGMLSVSGPVTLAQTALLAHVKLEAGAAVELPLAAKLEYGAYVLNGSVKFDEETGAHGHSDTVLLKPAARVRVKNASSAETAELIVLGGERAERPLVFHGSFVFGSREKAEQAEADFFAGKMGQLEDEE